MSRTTAHTGSTRHTMRHRLRLVLAVLFFSALTFSAAGAQEAGSEETWNALKPDVFGERPIEAASPLVRLDAPTRAEDAAMVPISIEVALPEGDSRTVKKLTLIVDENPAPVAATFTFGGARHDVTLGTRLRVNSYSYVRAIAELSDGGLYMTERFVKASGGCSAPAMKDEENALKNIGQMKLRVVGPGKEGDATKANRFSQLQLMIRHPNYSGLQMDQVTRLYIPAKFVDSIEVKQGDELVFSMVGGISLSEDPAIRFSYEPSGKEIHVDAGDTDGRTFKGDLKPAG
ncbi:quinoprotein dehydrogenase-associated SoxYZ-like carrier [Ancylobacter mangrovi]|uniref:Quinoprotein dehydrogenase-associated SoxYZ-like carrier n=1 Tax=Ancylobacter mangrovi TaxID=2972472 RepID=A0A9X2PCG5_9HYPH|nr:quinoprotein dehydrogenase-associated SoxYZ-like carrier [Ancylobacter mangrovi]MCS0496227.1 quinoprotein dehydrogenase-associated SoxYZ-like carrier [Ancylobacter mangrovi]MCS0504225.1 quinoprotein dehydrogenase-associated SoxYZ-like carrier [Ancylobacter mangrovi]